MYEIRPVRGEMVVDLPRTGQFTSASLWRCLQSIQRDDIPGICVKDLLVCGVCRTSNDCAVFPLAKVSDVSKDDIGRLIIELMVLTTARGSYM